MATSTGQLGDSKMEKRKDDITPEEEQIENALKHLDMLQAKCCEVRLAIPQMAIGFRKVGNKRAGPEASFDDMVKLIRDTSSKIQEFTTLYTNEDSKKVFDQAWKSHEANAKGIRPIPQ